MASFYSDEELRGIGFKSLGNNVQISRKSSLYGVSRITIGNNVRIDDFCFLSAGKDGIEIGNYVHISVYSSLVGQAKIEIHDFVGLSSKVTIYSSNDDYTGKFMTNPTIPVEYTGVVSKNVTICKHALIGTGSVVLPGVKINTGAVLGALSLAQDDCEEFYIYDGKPAKKLIKRRTNILKLEKQFLEKQ